MVIAVYMCMGVCVWACVWDEHVSGWVCRLDFLEGYVWKCADCFAVVVKEVTWWGGADIVRGAAFCFEIDLAVAMLRSVGAGLRLHEEVKQCVIRNVRGMIRLLLA